MLDFDEYLVDLLAAMVHLRIFEFTFDDEECPTKDFHQFIMDLSDRVPHLEYVSTPDLYHYYKRVGGKLVTCDQTELPRFEF